MEIKMDCIWTRDQETQEDFKILRNISTINALSLIHWAISLILLLSYLSYQGELFVN